MLSIQRKLRTLQYHSPEHFSLNSEEDVKNILNWLENQKIRYYSTEDRGVLQGEDWRTNSASYLKQLKCPYGFEKYQNAALDWLLNYAIRLEYSDKKDNINERAAKLRITEDEDCAALDVNSVQFKNSVNMLRDFLRIPPHHDYLQVLKACRILIEKRLSPGAVKRTGDKMTLGSAEIGFDLGEKSSNEAGKALRLLHIEDLRLLQTQINEAIVAAQSQTADPKTDTTLGKVGR
ncbi:RNA transcription, translation and transport factor protein-like [Bolinopsis microptera]|uniref:RNA transcription, translation and transport factor protein-like n=1 Tax=Bolinopsis microptera TaxID=2820187 RepID=UPI0030795048